MNEREIKEKVEKGYIFCRSIVEILGKPEKHVQDTIKEYVQKMKENKKLIIIKEDYSETKEEEEGLFSIFVELELLIKGVGEIVFFCFDYMPSSVEILEPEELVYKNRDLSAFLNDLQQRLHTYDMALKQFKARNERLMNENLILMKTAVLLALSKDKMNKEKLITRTGIPQDRIDGLLSIMIKESRIIEEEGIYKLR